MHSDAIQAARDRRDIEPAAMPRPAPGSAGRNFLVCIGIDHYQYCRPLDNAVHDAIAASRLFQRMGFEPVMEPLLDGRATASALHQLVTDDLRILGPDDSLVVFYAGHGGTQCHRLGEQVVRTGYLLPVDAHDKVATWIDLEGWLRRMALLPPRHILVMLDACHSGIALDPILRWRTAGLPHDAPLAALMARRSRKVLTSTLDDQVALDRGPVSGHSLFTGCLIEALTHGLPREGGGVITGSELGLYVQRRVATDPDARQTPDFGAFAFDDRGEMALPIRAAPRTTGGSPAARRRTSLGWKVPAAPRRAPAR